MSRVGDELFKREMRGGMSGKEIVTLREGVCSEAWMGAGSVWDVEGLQKWLGRRDPPGGNEIFGS